MGLYPGRDFKVRFYGTRLFYKNNFKRTRLKFAQELLKNKLRTTEVPLQVEFVLKNTSRHFGVSLQVFLRRSLSAEVYLRQ